MDLIQRKCVPCEEGTLPLSKEQVKEFLKLVPEWKLTEKGKIVRKFKFRDFAESLSFVARIGELAEKEGHHPDIKIVYNRVTLELITHVISGLSENDFVMAAKINELSKQFLRHHKQQDSWGL